MWRCVKFREIFKGRRTVDEKALNRMILGLQTSLIELGEKDLIEEFFIPCLFKDHKTQKNIIDTTLLGMIFISYHEDKDHVILQALKENKLYLSAIVREEQVNDIRETLDTERKSAMIFSPGDVVNITEGDFKSLIGRVLEINKDVVKVSISIFGQEKIIDFLSDSLSK